MKSSILFFKIVYSDNFVFERIKNRKKIELFVLIKKEDERKI
jgi:hypothetical protein